MPKSEGRKKPEAPNPLRQFCRYSGLGLRISFCSRILQAHFRRGVQLRSPLASWPPIAHLLPAFFAMTISLSLLSIILGFGMGLPQIYGLINPVGFGAAVRRFPRSLPWGCALMLLGTAWFLLNLSHESIADFAAYKNILFLGFAAVGIGSCIFVQDFLAVRGLAVVLLLLAKLMVDTGRPHLSQTPLVLIIQTWAYALVVVGIWLTVSPWRLRDFLQWGTATEKRIKIGCSLRLAFGLLVALLGFTVY